VVGGSRRNPILQAEFVEGGHVAHSNGTVGDGGFCSTRCITRVPLLAARVPYERYINHEAHWFILSGYSRVNRNSRHEANACWTMVGASNGHGTPWSQDMEKYLFLWQLFFTFHPLFNTFPSLFL